MVTRLPWYKPRKASEGTMEFDWQTETSWQPLSVGSGRGKSIIIINHRLHHLPPRLHSALSFLLAVNGTLLATVEPTVETPPATADTPPFTSPTPIEGTVVTADLVISRLLPPTQATPPTAAPTTPLVTLKRPPVTRHIMPGAGTSWSLPGSENKSKHLKHHNILFFTIIHVLLLCWTSSKRWKHLLPCEKTWLFMEIIPIIIDQDILVLLLA